MRCVSDRILSRKRARFSRLHGFFFQQLRSALDRREGAFDLMRERLDIVLDILFSLQGIAHLLEGNAQLPDLARAEFGQAASSCLLLRKEHIPSAA